MNKIIQAYKNRIKNNKCAYNRKEIRFSNGLIMEVIY